MLDAAGGAGAVVAVAVRGRRGAAGPPVAWARELVATGREAVIGVVNSLTAGHVTALAARRASAGRHRPDRPAARPRHQRRRHQLRGRRRRGPPPAPLGHRRVAYVGGSPTAACSQARMARLSRRDGGGGPARPGRLRPGRAVPLPGRRRRDDARCSRCLTPPTAVFAACDEVAAGVVEAARARGLRVPEDLSVVGFDDTQLARYGSPPLTTVRQPLRDMGAVALRTALRHGGGREARLAPRRAGHRARRAEVHRAACVDRLRSSLLTNRSAGPSGKAFEQVGASGRDEDGDRRQAGVARGGSSGRGGTAGRVFGDPAVRPEAAAAAAPSTHTAPCRPAR